MTKSKVARYNARQISDYYAPPGMSRGSRGRVTDWIVGGRAVDSTGSPLGLAATTTTWSNDSNQNNLAIASLMTFQAVFIQPAPATSTPNIGRLRVDEVHGSIFVDQPQGGAAGQMSFAVAMYIADINNTTTLWNVRNPFSSGDVCRDDYLLLEFKTWTVPGIGGLSAISDPHEFIIRLPRPVVIGGGQALHVTVANGVSSTQSAVVHTAFRSRVGPVA